jgi:prepilin-type N-terminal cleavage/methylation domain-containing protein
MRRGFTLIELLIVVIIIGLLFSVLLPSFIGAQDKARHRQAPPIATPRPKVPAALLGNLPELDATDVDLQIAVAPLRVGLQVYNRYEARGRVKLQARSSVDPVLIEVPFPEGTIEARDVTFRVEGREPGGVLYGADGIRWTGVLPVQPSRIEASFVTLGGETFACRLPPATRSRALNVALDLAGAPGFAVPDRSLQPTHADGPHLRWQVQDLVTDRPLVVDLPGAQSPLGRAMQLFQLAGVAVLLFGAGFWYLSDLRRPGLLADFRWGHFLLLALNYCSFFVTFAVLGQVPTAAALALALFTSLPLLMLHVWRLLGRDFALRDTLPLAVLTIALTVAGVYGPAVRDYIFLAAALGVTAFVTATYPRWLAARRPVKAPEPPVVDAPAPREERPAMAPVIVVPQARAGHCLACGSIKGDEPFCGQCGTPRAAVCTCHRCQGLVTLPTHLMLRDAGARLHCPDCGDRLPC